MKATVQYFPVVQLLCRLEVVLTFEFEWNPRMWPFKWKPLNSTVYYPVQVGLNFLVFEKKSDIHLECRNSLRFSI